jgi:crotonobetainyl-CoA:carnitine CoA-transferase CaiB-like acyl-CoA transferase
MSLLHGAGVPSGPINTIDRTFADPQVQHLKIAQPVEHPRLGELNLVAQPCSISGFPRTLRAATPELGGNTDEVLLELGYQRDDIEALREKRVI